MASQYLKPYLDSNIYIWTLVGPNGPDPVKAKLSAEILQLAEDGHFAVYASTFIEAEVVKAPGEPPLSVTQEQKIVNFLGRSFFIWIEVDRLIAEKARQLVRDHGWKPADAVHVATALRAECDQLLTWDEPLRKNQDSYTVEGLEICEPHTAGWQTGYIPPPPL